MITPIVPAAAVRAALKGLLYPWLTISGIINAPTADTVATAEPEIAAKNMHTIIVTIPSPPVTWPIRESKKFTRRLAIPPLLIRLPASIKNGMARSGKESTPVMAFWAMIISGISE